MSRSVKVLKRWAVVVYDRGVHALVRGPVVAVALGLALAPAALAQEVLTVTSIIDFASTASNVGTLLTVAFLAVIGLGLGFWAAKKGIRWLKGAV